MEEGNQNKSILDNMPPRSAFKAGLFIGLAAMLIIGLLVALGFMFKGNNKSTDDLSFNNNTNTDVVAPANNNTGDPSIVAADVKIDPISKTDWVKGAANAPISIIEYSDAECPFCQRFHDTMNQVLQQYNGKVKLAYRSFPLTTLHPDAEKKAEAIECVGELGGNDKVWAFLDKLFVATGKPTLAQLGDVVSSLGINKTKFQQCLDSGKYASKVAAQAAAAQAAGAQGTPYSVILAGNQKYPVPGAYPLGSFKNLFDSLLK